MALKPPLEVQHAVIDVFSVNDGKLSVEQQIEVYGKSYTQVTCKQQQGCTDNIICISI